MSENYSKRLLLLIKLDAKKLFDRVKFKEKEYLLILSLKRTREHFYEIFKSKYETATFNDLKYCSEDVIMALDSFYKEIDEVKWYLLHTEDQPNMIDNFLTHSLKKVETYYNTLNLYIDAELGIYNDSATDYEQDFDESITTD